MLRQDLIFQLSPEIVEKANTILLIQPFQNFAKYLEKPEDINGWGIFDWWNLLIDSEKEYLQNLGAMKALIDYIQSKASAGRSRFSGRVVLAGGSAGAPVPAMITGFYPANFRFNDHLRIHQHKGSHQQ